MTEAYQITVIMAEFYALSGYLDAINDALTAGQMPGMRGFDHRVSQLCSMIEAETDQTQRQTYRQALQELLKRLDQCEQQMRAFKAHRETS